MTRSLLIAFGLLALAAFATAARDTGSPCEPATGAAIRLGAVFPPETLFSAGAADAYRGAAAMVDAWNACGGVNGRPVELVYIPAANRRQVLDAVEQLQDVPLIIGSGSAAVSDALVEAAQNGAFVYWEVSEPLDYYHPSSFSPHPNSYSLGLAAASYINESVVPAISERQAAALIYESRTQSAMTADGLRAQLGSLIEVEYEYAAPLGSVVDLAVRIRESGINIVIAVGFEEDADRLWRDMRQANANVRAWIVISGQSFRRNTCARVGNSDGLIAIGTTGNVSQNYLSSRIGAVYAGYQAAYAARFERDTSEQADLAASGVYLLLRYVLPDTSRFSSEGIRQAIIAQKIEPPAGLFGEGLFFPFAEGVSGFASAVVTQRQQGQFCTVYPDAVATCVQPLQPFPTWRERAKLDEETACRD